MSHIGIPKSHCYLLTRKQVWEGNCLAQIGSCLLHGFWFKSHVSIISIKEDFCTNQVLKNKKGWDREGEERTLPLFQVRMTLGLVALPQTAQAGLQTLHPHWLGPGILRASRRVLSRCGNNTFESEIKARQGTERQARSGRFDQRATRLRDRLGSRRRRGLAGRHLGRLSRRSVYHSMVMRSRPAPPQSLSGGAAAAAAPSLYKPQCPDVNGLQCIFQGNLLLSMWLLGGVNDGVEDDDDDETPLNLEQV